VNRFCVACGAALLSFATLFGPGAGPGLAAEIDTSAEFAFVTDFGSGKVLMEKEPDALMKPASMAKIMTVYIAFERIADGGLSLDDTFLISEKAWRKGGSKTFVEVGKEVSVGDLLYGVVVQSGNDAAIAIAEGISGTEDGFAEEMNYVARQHGMNNNVFKNATGWAEPDQVTTARDLNILATALIRDFPSQDFPDLYPMFAEKTFTYGGITQGSRNRLLWRDDIFDGGKTGYTTNAGYCLVGAAKRDDMRLIAVVLGSENDKRFNDVTLLMNYGFKYFSKEKRIVKDEPLSSIKVIAGVEDEVFVGANDDVILTLPKDIELEYSLILPDQVLAPVIAGDIVGSVKAVDADGNILAEEDLIYLSSIDELGFFERLFEIIWNWILSLFS